MIPTSSPTRQENDIYRRMVVDQVDIYRRAETQARERAEWWESKLTKHDEKVAHQTVERKLCCTP